jgi:hypothetical protein
MARRDPAWPTANNICFRKLFLNEAIKHINIVHKSIRLIILRRLMYKFSDFVEIKNLKKKLVRVRIFRPKIRIFWRFSWYGYI